MGFLARLRHFKGGRTLYKYVGTQVVVVECTEAKLRELQRQNKVITVLVNEMYITCKAISVTDEPRKDG